jgi:hypothetical protein
MTEIIKNINWTTVISTTIASGFVAIIVGTFQLIANRYTTRILDAIEKSIKINNKKTD